MKRIATRLVSLASLSLLTFGLASACASEQSAFPAASGDASVVGVGGAGAGAGGAGVGGTTATGCPDTNLYCPASSTGMGGPCCLGPTCGIDYGMGCVATPAQGHVDGG